MLVATHSPSAPGDYTPLKSSPLRPLNPNVILPLSPPMTPSSKGSSNSSGRPESDGGGGQRRYKPLPSVFSSHGSREKRRGMFLKKVKQESEERRWQARGGDEEIMRSIYLAERKRWEEGQARMSRMWQASVEDQEVDEWMGDALPDNDALFEDEELEAFVGQSSTAGPTDVESKRQRRQSGSAAYGSDDEDYDRIFQELILREEERSQASSAPPPVAGEQDDAYDQIFEELIRREEKESLGNRTAGFDVGQQDEDMMDISQC